MLYCAIYSNTLNFQTSNTTERDKKAAEWLESATGVNKRLAEWLAKEKTEILLRGTEEWVEVDFK